MLAGDLVLAPCPDSTAPRQPPDTLTHLFTPTQVSGLRCRSPGKHRSAQGPASAHPFLGWEEVTVV